MFILVAKEAMERPIVQLPFLVAVLMVVEMPVIAVAAVAVELIFVLILIHYMLALLSLVAAVAHFTNLHQ